MRKKQEETKLQRAIQAYLKSLGAYCFKVHGSVCMRAGIPDIIACHCGYFIGIEVKDGDNTPSPLQEAHGRQIQRAKGIFIVAYSIEDVRKELEKWSLI